MTPIFNTAKSICRNIEYWELSLAYSPNFVTKTFEEFTRGNTPLSFIVFIMLFISNSDDGDADDDNDKDEADISDATTFTTIELCVWLSFKILFVNVVFSKIHFWYMLSQSLKNSSGNGFSSISDIFPPCFNVNMFVSNSLIPELILELSLLFPKKNSAISYIRLDERNRFLPAIFIEFPR